MASASTSLDSLTGLPMQALAQQVSRLNPSNSQGLHQQNVLINIQQFPSQPQQPYPTQHPQHQPMYPPPYGPHPGQPPHHQPYPYQWVYIVFIYCVIKNMILFRPPSHMYSPYPPPPTYPPQGPHMQLPPHQMPPQMQPQSMGQPPHGVPTPSNSMVSLWLLKWTKNKHLYVVTCIAGSANASAYSAS